MFDAHADTGVGPSLTYDWIRLLHNVSGGSRLEDGVKFANTCILNLTSLTFELVEEGQKARYPEQDDLE